MTLRVLVRVIAFDRARGTMLLVKNRGMDFWYAPGGGWEYEHENLLECAKREMQEETGLTVELKKLLYVQEFHAKKNTIFLELFWLAVPTSSGWDVTQHVDLDPHGQVETARWFAQGELEGLKVFPEKLKDAFWSDVQSTQQIPDPFLGVS